MLAYPVFTFEPTIGATLLQFSFNYIVFGKVNRSVLSCWVFTAQEDEFHGCRSEKG